MLSNGKDEVSIPVITKKGKPQGEVHLVMTLKPGATKQMVCLNIMSDMTGLRRLEVNVAAHALLLWGILWCPYPCAPTWHWVGAVAVSPWACLAHCCCAGGLSATRLAVTPELVQPQEVVCVSVCMSHTGK